MPSPQFGVWPPGDGGTGIGVVGWGIFNGPDGEIVKQVGFGQDIFLNFSRTSAGLYTVELDIGEAITPDTVGALITCNQEEGVNLFATYVVTESDPPGLLIRVCDPAGVATDPLRFTVAVYI